MGGMWFLFALIPVVLKYRSILNSFFYSSDELLNKIWYAGAYTIQLSTIPSTTGRGHDHFMERYGYDNSAPAGTGQAVLTDGARRDRTVCKCSGHFRTLKTLPIQQGLATVLSALQHNITR